MSTLSSFVCRNTLSTPFERNNQIAVRADAVTAMRRDETLICTTFDRSFASSDRRCRRRRRAHSHQLKCSFERHLSRIVLQNRIQSTRLPVPRCSRSIVARSPATWSIMGDCPWVQRSPLFVKLFLCWCCCTFRQWESQQQQQYQHYHRHHHCQICASRADMSYRDIAPGLVLPFLPSPPSGRVWNVRLKIEI